MVIRTRSYPRAALIGNPSDGYFGKTIAFLFRNFSAEIELTETPGLEIIPQDSDRLSFDSLQELHEEIGRFGYYGGIRLLKASLKKFYEYCLAHQIPLHNRNFTLRYRSDIPVRLGLAGSSAIITACLRALMEFFQVEIAPPLLANLTLSVETEELGIGAGLQDRVAQAYEVPVFMDFDKTIMKTQGYGHYQPLDPRILPPLYIAYRRQLSEGSEVLHNDLQLRFDRGDTDVHKAMEEFAKLTQEAKLLLEDENRALLGPLLDRNFDLRRSICQISKENLRMIEAARSTGASAKFTGSGGAIIGTYDSEAMYAQLQKRMEGIGASILKPRILS